MARVVQASTRVDLPSFLSALKSVREGDFSVRLPDHWTGVAGKVADTFNEVVEMNQRLASELERLRVAIGHARTNQRARLGRARLRRVGRLGRERELAGRKPRAADQRGRARDRRGGQGRPLAEHVARCRRPPAGGRVPPHRQDGQPHGRAAPLLRGGSDARRARGRHRGQARRPGRRPRRGGHLEGSDRLASTRWPAISPLRSGTSPRSPPPSPTAICLARSPSTCAARCSSSRTRSTRWSTSSARSPPK